MIALKIFYSLTILYAFRNVLTLRAYLRKTPKELGKIINGDPKMLSEIPLFQLIITVFEWFWGITGWFTPLWPYFILISINNLVRGVVKKKSTVENIKFRFTLNSVFHLIIIGFLLWEIYKPIN